jgi:hypothetical protein
MDSAGKMVPVYEWTPGLKAEVLCKLGKANTQSMDPLLQLAKVRQDIWDMVVQLGQPCTVKEGAAWVKPLTSIMTFRHLASLSDNEKLHLLTALYNSKLTMSELEHQACHLKVQKQVEAAFAADARKPIEQCIMSLGKEHFDREVSVWITPFKKLGKGKTLRPNNFTVQVQELLASMASHNPQVCASAQQFEWTSPTGFSVKSFLQTLGEKENTPLTSFTSRAHLLLLFQYNMSVPFFELTHYSGILQHSPFSTYHTVSIMMLTVHSGTKNLFQSISSSKRSNSYTILTSRLAWFSSSSAHTQWPVSTPSAFTRIHTWATWHTVP